MDKKSDGKKSSAHGFWYDVIGYGSMDIWFLIIVLVLLCFGLIMMFSAGYPYADYKYNDSTFFIRHQAGYAAGGIAAMLVFSRIKPTVWQKLTWLIGIGSIGILILVLLLPPTKDGFHRWINLGFTTIQPSELAKFGVIAVGAYIYDKYSKKMSPLKAAKTPASKIINGFVRSRVGTGSARTRIGQKIQNSLSTGIIKESWIPTLRFFAFVLLCGFLVYKENHLSGCILMLGIGVVIMYLGGVRGRWFIIGIAAVAILGTAVCVYIMNTRDVENVGAIGRLLKGYMEDRIVAWLDKDYSPTDGRWQINQALYAIGSGGFFGKGLGNSTQKYMYVSEPQNDMIFSIVCEELGFIGAAIVIVLFLLLVYRGVVVGLNSSSRYGAILAMGIAFQVGLQVVLNVGVATDAIPNTGISLPFFSYGGTSLVVLMSEMGIVLSVSRHGKLNNQ